jgi:hypothetical protein
MRDCGNVRVRDVSDIALAELQDYLDFFQEAAQPGLTFDLVDGELVICFRDVWLGSWRRVGHALIFSGRHTTHVSTLHGAVLHTLGVLADVLAIEQAAA